MNFTKSLPVVLLLLLSVAQVKSQSVLYVAPGGSAGNAGTSVAAPTTLESAITKVSAGGTIYMRGGTYTYSTTILISRAYNGTSSGYKNIVAYNGEVPLLSFAGQSLGAGNRGIVLDAFYWHITGLIIEGSGDNGMLLSGNNNIVEKCIFRKNKDSGLQLSRYTSTYDEISEWPTSNLILNCEAYDNEDPGNENADGFAAKLTCGQGNIFRGCISHNNIDDGWDFYAKTETGPIGSVRLEGCVAYNNGKLSTGSTSGSGDKNGFKLGGSGIAVAHVVVRCVAFGNGHHGFTDNDNPGQIAVTNNTSYNNAESNFNFREGSKAVFKNNLSFNAGSSDKINGTDVSGKNVWWENNVSTSASGLVVSSADFVSLTPSVSKNADGSPNLGNFLALASGSDLINAGVTDANITYTGSAPDIGARESGSAGTTSYTLTVNASPAAGGSVSGGGTYASGTTATLTATAASGYMFTGWSGAASGSANPLSVTVDANKSITANFTAAATTYTLTTSASPAAGGSVSGGGSYAAGSTATLTATAAQGYTFTGWSGAASGTANPLAVTMNANKAVTANFQTTGGGGTATIRIEDNATATTGLCSYDGSVSSNSGANNGNVINLSNSAGKGIAWKVNAAAAGSYTLRWRYVNSSSGNTYTMRLIVNGTTINSAQPFPQTSGSTTFSTTTATVTLKSGGNTIRLETVASNATADIDWMEVAGNSPTAGNCNTATGSAKMPVETVDEIPVEEKAGVYPNPSKGSANIGFYLSKPDLVKIIISTAQGQLVSSETYKLEAGYQLKKLNTENKKAGVYVVTVSGMNKQQETFRLVVL